MNIHAFPQRFIRSAACPKTGCRRFTRAVPTFAFVVLGALFSAGTAVSEPTSYLPEGHRAYDFLEIMEHRFPLTGAHLATRPVTRAEIARLLFSLGDRRDWMTPVELDEYRCLMAEFSLDYMSRGRMLDDAGPVGRLPRFIGDHVYRNRRNLFSSVGDNYSLFLDPVLVSRASLGGKQGGGDIYTSSNGFILRGGIGGSIGYHIDVRDSRESGDGDYPETTSTTLPGRGYVKFTGDSAEFDETYAHIAYSRGPFVVSYARDRTVWGRGKRGSLLLSGYGAPYDMLRLETSFWKVKFVFFAAELDQYPAIPRFYYTAPAGVAADSVTVKKHLSGHRIELEIGDRLDIGLHETVVYGGRWDMAYLNPVMFLKGAEHANGDHDNAAMGLDFRYFIHRAHSVYGELLIDDITTTKLGSDWYGNKLGYQIGTFFVRPFGIRDFDARFEYSRMKPWVYTHRYPINSYTHYGDVLGHEIGPNADEVYIELRKRFTRRFHGGVTYIGRRHGANPEGANVGGDPLAGFRQGDPKASRFLDGVLEKYSSAGIDISLEILWQVFFRAGYAYERWDGEDTNRFTLSLGLNE